MIDFPIDAPTGPVIDPVTGLEIVAIRAGGIRLGQFLKLANLVDSGSDVKPLLANGQITVNDQIETRRGRQLARGDIVALGPARLQVG